MGRFARVRIAARAREDDEERSGTVITIRT